MKKLKILLFSILSICLFGVSAELFLVGADTAKMSTDMYAPSSYLEYYALNSPLDIAKNDTVTAILENDKDHKCIIIYENELFKKYSAPEYNFGNINQIKFLDDKLILQDGLRPYIFDYKNNSYSEIKDSENAYIPCTYFDFNENYFITNYSNTIYIYKIARTETGFSFVKQATQIASGTDNCIAINANNDIFYFKESKLLVNNLSSLNPTEYPCSDYSLSVSCASLKANREFLYFTYSNGLGRFNINKKTFETAVAVDTSMTLGSLSTPKGLCFNGENILVVDNGLNAVQEFTSSGGRLIFSGFAITTAVSGYNRLNNNAVDISIYNGSVAVFDSEKLLIITETDTGKTYKNFYFREELKDLDFIPTHISFNGKIVLFTNIVHSAFFNTETKVISKIVDADKKYDYLNPISTSYINGYFYILARPNGSSNVVIKVSETTFLPEEILTREAITKNDLITVDIDGYVYIYSELSVYKYTNVGVSRGIEKTFTLAVSSLEIGVDLNGNLYSLTADNKLEYFKTDTAKTIPLNFSENLPKGITANAFAMNFDSEKIYFLFGASGLILTTTEGENDNINNINLPNDFKITDNSAKPISELKIFTAKENANLFMVSVAENVFKYNGVVISSGKQYVYAGETDNFYILAADGIFLVKKGSAVSFDFSTVSDINSGYVSTSVNLYYSPIFLPEYNLTNFTRLSKSTPLTISGKLQLADANFYYATLTAGNKVISGYLPIEFVTDNIVEIFDVKNFSYKTLNAKKTPVNVYLDLEMKNLAVAVSADTVVKATKINDSLSYVEWEANGNITRGYVYNSAFLIRGKTAVRNSIIIIIVAVSVSATSIFFIFRKRGNSSNL